MPFIHRQVAPVFLGKLNKDDSQEIKSLADTQIRVLNGIIEQLSDISNQATDIVENIKDDCDKINARTGKIFERVSQVRQKVEELKTEEKVSHVVEDQVREQQDMDGQFFTPENRPQKIQELYVKADPIPNMDILQPYREDDLKCRHVYSHPGFFFELWKAQFEEAARKEKEKRREERKLRKKNRKKEPTRKQVEYTKLKTTTQRHIEEAIAKGIYVPNKAIKEGKLSTVAETPLEITDLPLPTEITSELPLPPPDLAPPVFSSLPDPATEPPVIFSTPEDPLILPPAPKQQEAPKAPPAPPAGPMPPPPPPPPVGQQTVSGTSTSIASQIAQAKLNPVLREETTTSVDTRSDLLKQIKEKRNLKKVQRRQSLTMTTKKTGIAGIFEKALEDIAGAKCYSDEEDDDSDDWSEEE